jgi:hypothetical protein
MAGWCRVVGAADADPGLSKAPTAEEVAAAIRLRGAGAVLLELHAEPERWARVYRGIASGQPRWLEVGQQLASRADAGWSEQIDLAFGEALAAAPARVLRMAPGLKASCGNLDDPFMSSLARAQAEVKKRQRAVGRVKDSTLVKQREDCLQALARLYAALPADFEK